MNSWCKLLEGAGDYSSCVAAMLELAREIS